MLIPIGQVGAPFGIQGAVHVTSFMDPPEQLGTHSVWHLTPPRKTHHPKSWSLQTFRAHGRRFVATLEGCKSRDEALLITNHQILIPAEQLSPLPQGEFYWHELIGLSVVNSAGAALGEVTGLLETGANDVLVVRQSEPSKEHLIPYVKGHYILEICPEQRQIVVDWQPDY